MNLTLFSILDGRLINDDDSKAFMILVHQEEAVHIATLTEAAKKCLIKLRFDKHKALVEVRKATVNGAPHAWVVLTELGKKYIKHRLSQWVDELEKWREIEGESHNALNMKQVAEELKDIRLQIEKGEINE